jgi:hypothetical protein
MADTNSMPVSPAPASSPPAGENASGKKGSKTIIIVLVVLVVLAVLCGVGALVLGKVLKDKVGDTISEEIGEELLEGATGGEVEIDADDETYTWEAEDGSGTIGSAAEWPDDIPSSIPEFTYATIESNFSLSDESGQGWSMTFSDSDANAIDRYTNDMESEGWSIVSTLTSGTVVMFTAEKDSYTVTASCDSENDACTVMVGVE